MVNSANNNQPDFSISVNGHFIRSMDQGKWVLGKGADAAVDFRLPIETEIGVTVGALGSFDYGHVHDGETYFTPRVDYRESQYRALVRVGLDSWENLHGWFGVGSASYYNTIETDNPASGTNYVAENSGFGLVVGGGGGLRFYLQNHVGDSTRPFWGLDLSVYHIIDRPACVDETTGSLSLTVGGLFDRY